MTMITPSYLGETIEYSSLHACRSTLEDPTEASAGALFAPNKVTNVFRPVTFTSLAMNWALGGDEPLGYHLLNLLLHAGVTWLLYLLLSALLEPSPQAKTIAFVSALVFAVHPIHTEAVATVMGRGELFAAGFLFAAWIFHLRDQEILAIVCFVLALLSKESAVVFFPLVLLGDYARNAWKPRLRYAAFAGVTLLYLGLLWKVQGGRFGQPRIAMEDNPLANISAGWRIVNAIHVAWKYAGLHVYPAVLSCDYSFNQIPVYLDLRHTLPATVAAIAVLGGWAWAVWKRRVDWAVAGGIYLVGFSITSNILIPTGTIMGERLAYLPSAGFCLLVAMAWSRLHVRHKKMAWGVAGVVILLLSMRTVARNRDWKDNLTLFSATVRAAPGSAKAHSNLGTQYMDHKQLDLARKEFQTSLQIYPDSPDTLAAYGLLESWQGHLQAAGAMMEKGLYMTGRDNPNYDSMVVNFAALLVQTNHVDGALNLLNQEVTEAPTYAAAWSTRAIVHYKSGDVGQARSDAEMALRLNPGNLEGLQVMNWLASSPSAASAR